MLSRYSRTRCTAPASDDAERDAVTGGRVVVEHEERLGLERLVAADVKPGTAGNLDAMRSGLVA